LSTTYSIDRFYSFIRASQGIAFFGFLLGLFYWLKDKSHLDKALNIYFGIIIFGIILNFFSLVLVPDRVWWWNAPERFQGVAGHPNSLGAFCMLSYPALMWKYGKTFHKGRFLIAILSCSVLFMHIISGSRTSLAASIFGLIVWNLALKNKAKLLIIFTLFVALGSGFLLNPVSVPSFERLESSNITDLTGRPDFWRASIQLIIEKPILGYGYEVAGKVWSDPRYHSKDLSLWIGSARTSLHNGYLSLVIGTGIILGFVFLTVLLIPLWRIMFTEPSVYKSLVLVIMLPILLLNMFESALFGAGSFISLILWFFWVLAARLPDIVRSENI
jgi:O-antigen ligase